MFEPETIHYKRRNISVLNTITFYIEEDDNEEVQFNGKNLNFTLHFVNI